MRSKSLLVLLVVFLSLLAVVLFLKPKVKDEAELTLVDLKSEDVRKISLKRGAEVLTFEKDGRGEWAVTEPLSAPADAFEVNRLAEDFASLKAEKVVDSGAKDPAEFGLPQAEISLWTKGQSRPVTIILGTENPLDKTIYAQKAGEARIVLLSGLLKSTLDKKLLDFRQKDVFRFETAEAGSIRLKSKDMSWEAELRQGRWSLLKPVAGPAQKTQLDGLLSTLSGLRAKDFVSEQKNDADMKRFGLDKPDFEVTVSLTETGRDEVFIVRKRGDKVYATTASSNKIIQVEEQLLADLEKKPDSLREKRPAVFDAWMVDRLEIRKDGLSFAVSRKNRGPWIFLSGETGPADEAKVETFIRQIGNMEATEFIDRPGPPVGYGLDRPRAEVKLQTPGEDGKMRETVLQFGAEDTAARLLVVKNSEYSNIFRVSSAIFDDFPKAASDWKKTGPKDKRP